MRTLVSIFVLLGLSACGRAVDPAHLVGSWRLAKITDDSMVRALRFTPTGVAFPDVAASKFQCEVAYRIDSGKLIWGRHPEPNCAFAERSLDLVSLDAEHLVLSGGGSSRLEFTKQSSEAEALQ